MKQIYQSIRTGKTEVANVPAPRAGTGQVLIRVAASLVSAGTERMIVQFAGKSLLQKARARPDLVRQVLDKARREGVITALTAAWSKLDQPMPLGYSVSGIVLEAGADTDFRPGDRVAAAGANFAVHAEYVAVPKNLVAVVPDAVPLDDAAFATLAAIALQGVRLAEPTLGATAGVIGLGLLGQITGQLLRANGCRVVGVDPNPARAEIARRAGADDVATSPDRFHAAVAHVSGGRGADAVLITADTDSNEPIETAAGVSRDRGIIVAVGAVGVTVPRKVFFEKELVFRISRSYGPGRYDPEYELKGHDYPIGYVRWTEQRNMEAVLQLMAKGQLDCSALISHRFPIERASDAMAVVTGRTQEPFLAVLLEYPDAPPGGRRVEMASSAPTASPEALTLGLLGAGLFATATLLPAATRVRGISFRGVCTSSGLSGHAASKTFGFRYSTTTEAEIFADQDINTVAIATRHRQHARQVQAAFEAGKHVFVEKPLCLNRDELDAILAARESAARDGKAPTLMVGFNRRFAPFVREIQDALKEVREPLIMSYRVNAGYLPPTHWTQDPEEGGRLLGEGCHFIDLLYFLAGSPAVSATTFCQPDLGRYSRDNFVTTLEFANGTIGTVTYVAAGHRDAGKERLEVFGGGMTAALDDFRRLKIHSARGPIRRVARLRQDKGHRGEWEALAKFLQGHGPEPMSFQSVVESTTATLAAQESLLTGHPVPVG